MSEGTSQEAGPQLPPSISVADDLLITANVLAGLGAEEALRRVIEHPRPALGPRAALLYVSAPNLGEALTGLCLASNLNHPYMELAVERDNDFLELVALPKINLGRLSEFLMPLAALTLYKVVQAIAAEKRASVTFRTTLCESQVPANTLSDMGCIIATASAVNGLKVPVALASLPNPESDPTVWLLAQENFRHQAQIRQSTPSSIRIRERIVQLLTEEGQSPRLKQIAAEEGLSTRTVIRMLAAEGTTFFELVEQERRKRAVELINNPALGLDSVAAQLGFSDRSSFGRSFRKWFGMAPGEMRRNLFAKVGDLSISAMSCGLFFPLHNPPVGLLSAAAAIG
ncbi:hypothetical protein LK12_01330 [Novosphingobium malaysiense]|uniref:HTH araC/xylS-type domain-containing protein n=1 Tax=Novosphingobium malaysiense TaxID=1348853 RepID=A0A0B1ZV57_9SPHN|nr:hypothetical protein LK12_01330 [Novosphingobium malaysiense]